MPPRNSGPGYPYKWNEEKNGFYCQFCIDVRWYKYAYGPTVHDRDCPTRVRTKAPKIKPEPSPLGRDLILDEEQQ